jgi:hypothetical protein
MYAPRRAVVCPCHGAVVALVLAPWKAIDWLSRRPPATCRVERRRVFSLILLIIIIVVVLALLGFFGRGRF